MLSVFKYFSKNSSSENSKKFLIVGLGNVGLEYENTRHNIGFEIINKLSKKIEGSFETQKYGEIHKSKYGGKQLLLLKPNTFMNLSGKAVKYWLSKEKINSKNLIVIVDDLNLDFGISRLRPNGSDGGHNGLKSIIKSLNNSKFTRLRFGIGNNFKKENQVDFVLSKWNNDESLKIDELAIKNVEIILSILKNGIEFSMNKFN
mgnify:FL=1